MYTPLISIIVPVYKAEAYLHRCVDSILSQTFHSFEVLLIDDGSPDKSGEICDEYAMKDNRVRVFHKENGGVSSTRQYGIDNAWGEYTIHVDPDDWIESNMLEELYVKAKEDDADMVICDFYDEQKKGQIYRKQEPAKLDYRTVFKEFFQKLHCSCCNKLIRRTCYSRYNIRFPNEMNLWEDGYVMFSLTMNPIKISYLPKAFYHYDNFTNCNSIVRKPTVRDLESMKYLISYLETKIDINLYYNDLYGRKCHAKSLAFSLNIPYNEFYSLYEEINVLFIKINWHNRSHKTRKLYMLMAFCLNNNSNISKWLRSLYKLFYAKILRSN